MHYQQKRCPHFVALQLVISHVQIVQDRYLFDFDPFSLLSNFIYSYLGY